jgi:hypothetical protein
MRLMKAFWVNGLMRGGRWGLTRSGVSYNVSAYLFVAAWEAAKHLPWFARKRLINWLAGPRATRRPYFRDRDVLYDFVLSDRVALGGFVSSGWFIFVDW